MISFFIFRSSIHTVGLLCGEDILIWCLWLWTEICEALMERKPTDFYDRAPVRRTWKPPCTERYTRWCERSARELTSYSIEAMRKMPGENSLPKKGKSGKAYRNANGNNIAVKRYLCDKSACCFFRVSIMAREYFGETFCMRYWQNVNLWLYLTYHIY